MKVNKKSYKTIAALTMAYLKDEADRSDRAV
jgi:hypothetical protein